MINELRKYLSNQKREGMACEKILGTNTAVNKFAGFWDKSQDDLMVVAAVKLNEYLSGNTFTADELTAYRKGLADVSLFFAACSVEREEKIKEKELAKKNESVI